MMVPYVRIGRYEFVQVDAEQKLIVYDATKFPPYAIRTMWKQKWIHCSPNLEAYLLCDKKRIETLRQFKGRT